MSEYTEALAALVALRGRLDRQLARTGEQVAAERRRSEREIESYTEEHEAVLARLEATLARARAEGMTAGSAAAGEPSHLGADPLDQATQLVVRLEQALDQALHTRRALASEEAARSEEEKRRAAEERRRREREGLLRDELWERARQGSKGLLVGLGVFAVLGLIAGALGLVAVAAAALAAAAAGAALAARIESTLPALAVQRASGARPQTSSAPAREWRLAVAGYAGASLGLAGLGALLGSLAGGGGTSVSAIAAFLSIAGITVTVCVYIVLPRAK